MMVQQYWFIVNMNHEELLHEYEVLRYQLFGQAGNGSGLTYDQLQQEVHAMYGQFPAVPNLTKESYK
jgi:hypothetical protein